MTPSIPNDDSADPAASAKLEVNQPQLEIEGAQNDGASSDDAQTNASTDEAGADAADETMEADEDSQNEGEQAEDEGEEEEEAEPEDEGDPNQLVTLESYRYAYEAELAKLHLEMEGITTFIIDAETVTMDWFLGNALGYIKLQVARCQYLAAQDILDRAQPDLTKPRQDGDSDEFACLSCGAALTEDQISCPSCGWSYEAGQDTRIIGENPPDTRITER